MLRIKQLPTKEITEYVAEQVRQCLVSPLDKVLIEFGCIVIDIATPAEVAQNMILEGNWHALQESYYRGMVVGIVQMLLRDIENTQRILKELASITKG